MFKGLLEEVVRSTEGGIAALVMGYDGIPVDHYIRDDAPIDVETIGMEFSVILKDIQKAALMLDAGKAQEVAIRAERMTTVIRLVSDQFFLALALAPTGNIGKARYLLRTHAATVRDQLV
jgi:predicted regulator of Ras-like GTPase activity (Roadblock/LC7/MglB family)